nr:hypothetical protein [Shouchella shacheensis]
MKQAKQAVQLRRKDGELLGYGLSVQLPDMLLVGPIIASREELAILLIHELAKEAEGPIRIDLFSRHQRVIEYLRDRHLGEIRIPPVMLKNADELPGNRSQLVAVAAQVFG